MARADIQTLIPLDRAARILGIDSYHFNGIYTTRRPIQADRIDDVWFQYAWQHVGAAGRDDLSFALKDAEQTVIKYLKYSPLPHWIIDEEVMIVKPAVAEMISYGLNTRGKLKSAELKEGYVIAGGVRAKTLIDDAVAIVYSDSNGDGYNDLATVTVATTVTDPEEIHIFFPGESGAYEWEIRPIDVSIAGGNATITFPRYLVPLPDLWERDPTEDDPNTWRMIDGDVIGNFLTTVDVYRVYHDPSDQVTFYTEGSCSSCNGSGCPACNWTTETGCIRPRDSRLGIVTYFPATWDDENDEWDRDEWCCGEPLKMYVNYRAGRTDPNLAYPHLQMDRQWEKLIVYYALTLLDRASSRIENTGNIWKLMTQDLSMSVDGGNSWQLTDTQLGNPLGTTRAAILLWNKIEKEFLPK